MNFFLNKMNSDKDDDSLPAGQAGITTLRTSSRQAPRKVNQEYVAGIKINLITAAVFFIGCFFIWGCENNETTIKELTENKVMVEEGKNIESYLSQQSKVKAKLTAPLMLRYQTDTVRVEFPKTLHVDFYDDSTKIETWLDSKHGKYFENLNKVYLWDSVVVINVKGDTLKSSDLWWDQNTKLFYTDKYAEYRTKDKQIFPSKGIEATQDLGHITFKSPTGIVNYSDKYFTQ
ncbi:MAG TPA: LPS export ABC transporter periplasmic protein LptC [Chitinophagaceae bacterium]|jgi:LPS export ABC transporter protein LptC|nr:LPS export ABC transporter periplasmic protein LptC [Chitinophagaceae bacterium]